jgi:hypothetical protein
MKKTILLLSVVLLTSCKRVLMTAYGIRQPKIESNESITRFLKKANIETAEIYHVDSANSYSFWNNIENINQPIDLKIFNGKGELLKKLEQNQCTGIYSDQIAGMNLPGALPVIIKAENAVDVLKKFERIDGKRPVINDFDKEGFLVCITFSNAFGKAARNNISSWTNALKKNKSADKIKILYMNMDMHTSWGIKSRKDPRRMKFNYS